MDHPRVALMQPAFLPWQGFFALAASADVFVLLDDFQFQRHSFHHRNRLRVGGREAWVGVPVAHAEGDELPTLAGARPLVDAKWRRRMHATLDQSYGRTPGHATVRAVVDPWIDTDWHSLADMNAAFVHAVAELLGFAPRWLRSSAIAAAGKRSERVLALLRATGARTYLCARGAYDYMAGDGLFPVDDVEVVFQAFEPQPYPQRRAAEFTSHLSVLDALFETGPAETRRLVLAGQRPWTPWPAMAATAAATRAGP